MDLLAAVAPAVQHEVNNALMVLASNLDLLGRSAPDGPARRQLDRATEAARRLDATVRGYLDVARRAPADAVTLAPDQILAQLSPLLRVALGARLKLEVTAAENCPAVTVDRTRLDVALISAAREAAAQRAQAGIMTVSIRPDGTTVQISLRLPEGVSVSPGVLGLLAEAAAATGGSCHPTADGAVLSFPAS